MKKLLVATGGGDCPGLNAVIRGIVRRASLEPDWEVYGSIEAYNGVMNDPFDIVRLDNRSVSGIHVRGGTIIGTTNKGNPMEYPVLQSDGTYKSEDRTDFLIERMREFGADALISIGGDGSQRISKALYDKGFNVIGVPKTIDNDLAATDFTFGFQTAVQIATEALDKLVTTAASHNRVMIMEVMGRDAGWIALHTALAGGAEICLIPEIPYDPAAVLEQINRRYSRKRGFVNIVIAEGATPLSGEVTGQVSQEVGYQHVHLGGVGYRLQQELKACGCDADIRVTVLGHTQRGGTPTAFDRVLATAFGVYSFELVLARQFGRMVSFRNNTIVDVTLEEATAHYNHVDLGCYQMRTARGVGISFGE